MSHTQPCATANTSPIFYDERIVLPSMTNTVTCIINTSYHLAFSPRQAHPCLPNNMWALNESLPFYPELHMEEGIWFFQATNTRLSYMNRNYGLYPLHIMHRFHCWILFIIPSLNCIIPSSEVLGSDPEQRVTTKGRVGLAG